MDGTRRIVTAPPESHSDRTGPSVVLRQVHPVSAADVLDPILQSGVATADTKSDSGDLKAS